MYYQTYFRDYNSLQIKRDDSFWNEVQNHTGSHRDVHNLQTAHPNITTLCSEKRMKLKCGPMPNVMVALLNIDGALCSTPQSLADAHY